MLEEAVAKVELDPTAHSVQQLTHPVARSTAGDRGDQDERYIADDDRRLRAGCLERIDGFADQIGRRERKDIRRDDQEETQKDLSGVLTKVRGEGQQFLHLPMAPRLPLLHV